METVTILSLLLLYGLPRVWRVDPKEDLRIIIHAEVCPLYSKKRLHAS